MLIPHHLNPPISGRGYPRIYPLSRVIGYRWQYKKKHPLFLLFSGNIPETIYFPCKIVLIYQECGDSTCRSHNEITRQRGQINTIGVGLLRTRNSGKFYTVCVIILHGVFCVRPKNTPPPPPPPFPRKWEQACSPLMHSSGGPGKLLFIDWFPLLSGWYDDWINKWWETNRLEEISTWLVDGFPFLLPRGSWNMYNYHKYYTTTYRVGSILKLCHNNYWWFSSRLWYSLPTHNKVIIPLVPSFLSFLHKYD